MAADKKKNEAAQALGGEPLQWQGYDFAKKEAVTVSVNPALFLETPNTHVMHLALIRQLHNARRGTASTKTRAEVAGGGKKPWKQKGTGRARAGSIRSPLWRKGGITFGPKPRKYYLAMPKQVGRLALRSALTARKDACVVVQNWGLDKPSTKALRARLKQFGLDEGQKVLIILGRHDKLVQRSARNLPGVSTLLVSNLNVKQLIGHDRIVFAADALAALQKGVES